MFNFYSAKKDIKFKLFKLVNVSPVILKVKLMRCCFAVFEITSSFVGILMSGAGPGIHVVSL